MAPAALCEMELICKNSCDAKAGEKKARFLERGVGDTSDVCEAVFEFLKADEKHAMSWQTMTRLVVVYAYSVLTALNVF